MRNKIFGAIGAIWGGGILVNWLLSNQSSANEAYQSGQNGAVIFGGLMFLAGVYYFFKKPANKASNESE